MIYAYNAYNAYAYNVHMFNITCNHFLMNQINFIIDKHSLKIIFFMIHVEHLNLHTFCSCWSSNTSGPCRSQPACGTSKTRWAATTSGTWETIPTILTIAS